MEVLQRDQLPVPARIAWLNGERWAEQPPTGVLNVFALPVVSLANVTTRSAILLGATLLAAFLVIGAPAHAALGESRASIQADHAALGGTALVVTSAEGYEVHQTTTADGGQVRQYVDAQGTVFAVSWSSRFQPNLKQLLGSYYDDYLAAARAHRGGHHVLSVTTPRLVLGIVQRPRGSAGLAHAPALLPPGVTPDALR